MGYAARNDLLWLRDVSNGCHFVCVCIDNVEPHIKAVMLLKHYIVFVVRKGLDVLVFIVFFFSR